jgi:7-cyano-7-deazaguanine synthase
MSETDAPGKAVVLLSGGMDSATLLHYVRKELKIPFVLALSVRYGQKHLRELDMARWQAEAVGVAEHRIVDMSFLGDLIGGASALTAAGVPVPDLTELSEQQRRQPPTYVPNRNMALLAVAAAYAEARDVADLYYGAQAQDEYGYWDCTVDFLRRINDVLRLNRGKPVTVHAPLIERSKADVLRLGAGLGVDFSHTWSCYRGEAKPCGDCPTCVERRNAFRACGMADPLGGAGI